MSKLIPPIYDEGKTSPGEKIIFNKFKNDLTDWIVLHSLDIADPSKRLQGEADFVVIVPGKGVLVTEVKSVRTVKREGGIWYLGNNPKQHISPFKQASLCMHDIRTKLYKKKPNLSNIMFWSAVIFTEYNFHETSVEWDDWQIINKENLNSRNLSNLILEILDRAKRKLISKKPRWFNSELNIPTIEQCAEISQFLRGDFEYYQSPKSRAERLERDLIELTQEQYDRLDEIDENDRILIKGPAGTGKTLLAIEAARRSCQSGCTVLFVCYNSLLGDWLINQTVNLGDNIITSTLHKYMLKISGLQIPKRIDFDSKQDYKEASDKFWKDILPQSAVDKLLLKEKYEKEFDKIIIDEAPDLIVNEKYLGFLDLIIKKGLRSGNWLFFGDFEKQDIYERKGEESIKLLQSYLNKSFFIRNIRTNCRNTPIIAKYAEDYGLLAPGYKRVLRQDDEIKPDFIKYSSIEEQENKLIRYLNDLVDEGYKLSEIVILSPIADNCCASHIKDPSWRKRIKSIKYDGNYFIPFCTIQSFKGLESRVVIVTDMDFSKGNDYKRSLLYIAITRTLEKFIMFEKINDNKYENEMPF